MILLDFDLSTKSGKDIASVFERGVEEVPKSITKEPVAEVVCESNANRSNRLSRIDRLVCWKAQPRSCLHKLSVLVHLLRRRCHYR